MAILEPSSVLRRSPLNRRHLQSHGLFKKIGENLLVEHYANEDGSFEEYEQAQVLAICDLCTLPRIGFKGAGALAWLKSQNIALPELPNTAVQQNNAGLATKLSEQEVLILSDIFALNQDVNNLSTKADIEHQDCDQKTYVLPRGDSHCWLAVTGMKAAEMFSKICAVDLRGHKFSVGSVAQTSVAKTNAVVIRNDLGSIPCFYILSDISGTEFLWDCLLDAMAEYKGYPVGINALHRLITEK